MTLTRALSRSALCRERRRRSRRPPTTGRGSSPPPLRPATTTRAGPSASRRTATAAGRPRKRGNGRRCTAARRSTESSFAATERPPRSSPPARRSSCDVPRRASGWSSSSARSGPVPALLIRGRSSSAVVPWGRCRNGRKAEVHRRERDASPRIEAGSGPGIGMVLRRKEKPRFAGLSRKPTMGFEPMTPALRERCSGQLSYVGEGGECSRGIGFSRHGCTAFDSRCARVLGAACRAVLVQLAAGRRAASAALPLCPYLRHALSPRPVLDRRTRRHRARRSRRPAVAGPALPRGALGGRGSGLARRPDEAAQPQRQRCQRQVLLDVQLQRLPRVLAELRSLAQAPRVARLRGSSQAVDAIRCEHGPTRALGHADEVAEGEGRELKAELEHLRAGTAARALAGLVELLLERPPLAVLRLELEPLSLLPCDVLRRPLARLLRAREQGAPWLRCAMRIGESGAHHHLDVG